MNILFNLIPIKKGGGQQVATNFISIIAENDDLKKNSFFVVTENTNCHLLLKKLNFNHIQVVKNSIKSRFFFELFTLTKLVKENKIEVIYTMFGPNLKKIKNIPSVVGCAYSNIFYPEVPFWNGWPIYKRILFFMIDRFRLKRTLNADGIIFENKSMLQRANKLYGYPIAQTTFIKPSISVNKNNHYSNEIVDKCITFPEGFKLLVLSGWHKNKNIAIIPSVLAQLKGTTVTIIITVPPDHPESVHLLREAQRLGVEKNILLIDTVKPTDVAYLYSKIDAVLLLSLLESFSNNIIESWVYEKPIIISDLEWAKSICNDAAIYVNRDNPFNIARSISELMNNHQLYLNLITKGKEEANSYPSPHEKVYLQLKFIKTIANESH